MYSERVKDKRLPYLLCVEQWKPNRRTVSHLPYLPFLPEYIILFLQI